MAVGTNEKQLKALDLTGLCPSGFDYSIKLKYIERKYLIFSFELSPQLSCKRRNVNMYECYEASGDL